MNIERNGKSSDIRNLESTIKALAGTIDFILFLFRLLNQHLGQIINNLSPLPNVFTTEGSSIILSETFNSIIASGELITKILPSEKLCGKEKLNAFWYRHSALISYEYEALILLRYSLFSAFTSYYGVAFTELRSAMEAIVLGAIYDLLAIPKYRNNAKILQEIRGFSKALGFDKLLKTLNEELGENRAEVSAEIFDIINEKIQEFNPEASFIKYLRQLKDWEIIDDEMFRDINSYYVELSKYVHRIHPNFSDVGIRILADKDWLDLEPIPETLFEYLHKFNDINGLRTYLVLKVFSIDLIDDEFRKCIDWPELDKGIQLTKELAKTYTFWRYVAQILDYLKT
ncbi:hypothetical protein Igag_0737 [Ignisphaera aggregans DSM 17230]|uniref:Uncharacterized protein n=1 Tax=Ignisphaera aggregans (strain DSM 17230 / JCM 13409 / AQ1.S1) TaxID=583356 RepID=E0ST90_IGNAA|nr:hypothetical protein Igag_0737 [Ignisphaera aggregans DSM 17230]